MKSANTLERTKCPRDDRIVDLTTLGTPIAVSRNGGMIGTTLPAINMNLIMLLQVGTHEQTIRANIQLILPRGDDAVEVLLDHTRLHLPPLTPLRAMTGAITINVMTVLGNMINSL